MPEILKTVLDSAIAYPTVIFTVLFGLVVLYWIFSLLTGTGGEVDGAIEGLAEGLLEGVAEGAVEGLVESAAEGLMEGAAEGLVEGASEGVLDGAAEGAIDAGGGVTAKAIGCLGLTVVPATLVLTLTVGFSWISSIVLTRLLGRHVGIATTGLVAGSVVALGSLALGLVFTTWAVRPIKPLFIAGKTFGRKDIIGLVCTVTTLSVSDVFGMAEYDDGGSGLLLQVRCSQPNDLVKGSPVKILRFDPTADAFIVREEKPESKDTSSWVLENTRPPNA